MKSIFNFRPLFVIFLGFILGAVFYNSIVNMSNKYWLGVFIVLCVFVFLMVVYVILGALKLKPNFFKYLTKTYNVWLVFMISIIAFGAIFSLACAIKNHLLVDITGKVNYNGVITSTTTYDNYVRVELRDVVYANNKSSELNSNLNVIIYTKGSDLNLNIGNTLSSSGYISKAEFTGYNVYNYSAVYSTSTYATNVEIVNGSPNIFEKIKLKTKLILTNNMSAENANIAYAMLFGEKDDIDKNIYNVFSIAGISHILAVSGLHIGVFVAVLLFILKKCKLNKLVSFIVLCGVLLLYMILCGFTPSVVRASLMAIIMFGASIYGKQYDSLSSLSLSAIIICLFNPFAMFKVGFQLSFACVFAIITLSPVIDRFFAKFKFENSFSKSISMSIATSLALIPFCAHYFGRVSLLSILTNVVVIPLFSYTYILLFIFTIISLLINFVGAILVVPNLFIHLIKLIANFVANLKYSYILVFDVSAYTFILVLLIQYIIQFMVGNKILKISTLSVLCILLAVSMVLDFLPKKYNKNQAISFNQYYGNMVILTDCNKDVTLIGYNYNDYTKLSNVLKLHKINQVHNVILYDAESNIENLNSFIFDYKVNHLYLPKNFNILNDTKTTIHLVENSFVVGSYLCDYINNSGTVGVGVSYNNNVTVIGKSFTKSDLALIANKYYNGVNTFIVDSVTLAYDNYVKYNNIITQSNNKYFSNIVLDNQKIWYSCI